MGGVEESEARNYLPNKDKSQFFVIFTNLAVFIIFFLRNKECLTKAEIFFGDHPQPQQQFLGHG